MATAKKLAAQLAEKFGKDTVMMVKERPRYPAITCGSLALDYAIGIGGFPSDRVIEIAGAEGTGKTTLALLAMKKFLEEQPERAALFLDLEHKLDMDWLESLLGEEIVNDRLIYVQPDNIEQATNIYKKAVVTGDVCFVALDSIGGAPTVRANEDAEVGSFGGNSLGVKRFAEEAANLSAKYRCLTIGINQIRADMAGYNRHMVPGGKAWLHATALRLQLKQGKGKLVKKIQGEDMQVGYEILAKVIKNGLGAPGRTASYWFYNVPTEEFGFGVDTLEEIVRLGILTGVIDRKGGWYHHPLLPEDKGEHKVLGKEKLIDVIRADKVLQDAMSAEINGRLADHGAEVAPMSDPDEEVGTSGFPRLMEQDPFE